MSILYADKISKVYGVTPVLTDVSFRVEPKDRIGIVGANGAGKTTLINILAGELSPDGGTLHKASDLSVGYLKQRDHFCPDRTVEEEMMGILNGSSRQKNSFRRSPNTSPLCRRRVATSQRNSRATMRSCWSLKTAGGTNSAARSAVCLQAWHLPRTTFPSRSTA